MRTRRRLPFEEWPEADRRLWRDLFAESDFLDEGGPLAHLRPATRGIHKTAYAFWLGWLRDQGVNLDKETPLERASEARLREYHASLERLALGTRAQQFYRLYRTLAAAFPQHDWSRLRAAAARLQREQSRAAGRTNFADLPPVSDVVALGEALIDEAQSLGALNQGERAVRARDGAAILLLTYCPLRIGNLGRLEIGRSLVRMETGFVISFEPEETKSGAPIIFALPRRADQALRLWLDEFRPKIARFPQSGAHVWISKSGAPTPPYKLSERIADLTARRLGTRLSAHRFRSLAATTAAEAAPDQAKLIRPLLSHRSNKVADIHYNRANMAKAVANWGKVIDS